MTNIPPDFTLSVVIPGYNEERTLATLVDAVRAVPIRKQIILVDDCSKRNPPSSFSLIVPIAQPAPFC